MVSVALQSWRTAAVSALDEVEAAHSSIGGTGPGRRYATGQLNNAYAVLLSSRFQAFCRALHSEAAYHLAGMVPPRLFDVMSARLTEARKLDTGNPNPGNIGADFNRLGFGFWQSAAFARPVNVRRRRELERLNEWRNAIAHHDFAKPAFAGRTTARLAEVRRWRRACDGLAGTFDDVVRDGIGSLSGAAPW